MKKTIEVILLVVLSIVMFSCSKSSQTMSEVPNVDTATLSDAYGNSVTFWKDGSMSGKVFSEQVNGNWKNSNPVEVPSVSAVVEAKEDAAVVVPTTVVEDDIKTDSSTPYLESVVYRDDYGDLATFFQNGTLEVFIGEYALTFTAKWESIENKSIEVTIPSPYAEELGTSKAMVYWDAEGFETADPFVAHYLILDLKGGVFFYNKTFMEDEPWSNEIAVFSSGNGATEIKFFPDRTVIISYDGTIYDEDIGDYFYCHAKELEEIYLKRNRSSYLLDYVPTNIHQIDMELFIRTKSTQRRNYGYPIQVTALTSKYQRSDKVPDIWRTDVIKFNNEILTRKK